MFEQELLTLHDHKRNLVLNSAHEVFWGFGMAFHSAYAVIPLFLKLLGAPEIIIGSVAGAFVICVAIPQLYTAYLGRNIRNIKLAVMSVHLLAVPPIFIAGFIFAFLAPAGPYAWIIYYVCFLLFTLALGFVFPVWADFLDTVHIRERRGAFFGVSFAFNSMAGILGGLTIRALLSSSVPFPQNFGYGFLVYSFCMTAATLVFILYRTRRRQKRPSQAKTFSQFLSEVKEIFSKDRNFRRYIVSRILVAANYPAISLYAVYTHDKLNFDISEAGVFTVITVLVAAISNYVTGKIGDRFGHKRTIVLAFCAYFLALVTALAATTMAQTYLIFIFLGIGQGGFWTSAMSLIYEFAGENDKKIYFALVDSLTAPFVLLFIVLAGILGPQFGIPFVLKGIGIFLVFGLLSLTFYTKEPRITRAEAIPPRSLL